jgi:hypothetical protein
MLDVLCYPYIKRTLNSKTSNITTLKDMTNYHGDLNSGNHMILFIWKLSKTTFLNSAIFYKKKKYPLLKSLIKYLHPYYISHLSSTYQMI